MDLPKLVRCSSCREKTESLNCKTYMQGKNARLSCTCAACGSKKNTIISKSALQSSSSTEGDGLPLALLGKVAGIALDAAQESAAEETPLKRQMAARLKQLRGYGGALGKKFYQGGAASLDDQELEILRLMQNAQQDTEVERAFDEQYGEGFFDSLIQGFKIGFNPLEWPKLFELGAAELDNATKGKGMKTGLPFQAGADPGEERKMTKKKKMNQKRQDQVGEGITFY